jgi:methionyl-tRNA formyltransferase
VSRSLRIIFAGTPDFAVPVLQALIESPHRVVAVYTRPDRPAGRGRKLRAGPVKQLAQAHDLPVRQPHGLKDAGVQRELAQFEADIMVVVAYGLLLPPEVLAIPRLGCVNVHASLLPRWRGAAPIQRAILAGDETTGVTIMQMDAGLDTGDMLASARCDIGPQDTARTLHDRLAELGARLLLQTLEQIAAGEQLPVAQNDEKATYAAKLDKSEAWLDWRRPAVSLARQVCAFNPWPVAQTTLDGMTVRIWEACATSADCQGYTPGCVIRTDKQGIEVATGEGVLRITQIQLPGKRCMHVADVLNARPDFARPATCFGSGAEDDH